MTATADLTADPIERFRSWHEEWAARKPADAAAAVLATADQRGRPSARYVDVARIDHGFVFFTNHGSRKGVDLAVNPHAELCFGWLEAGRQIRVFGPVSRLDDVESDAHFATLAQPLALMAWASDQRSTLEDPGALESRLAEVDERLRGQEIPRPLHWGGYRLLPEEAEFWEQRGRALPERTRYVRVAGEWREERVSP